MNNEIKLKFGKYKGTMLKNIPDNYLKWCVDRNILRGKAMFYAKKRLKKFRIHKVFLVHLIQL